MSRTYDPDHILSALIEAYQQEEHFILRRDGKIYARFIVEKDGWRVPLEFCLSDIAAHAAERMSR